MTSFCGVVCRFVILAMSFGNGLSNSAIQRYVSKQPPHIQWKKNVTKHICLSYVTSNDSYPYTFSYLRLFMCIGLGFRCLIVY